MTDLPQRVRKHLDQCHRRDQSEHLLAELLAENERLRMEAEATKEAARSRMARSAVVLSGEGGE